MSVGLVILINLLPEILATLIIALIDVGNFQFFSPILLFFIVSSLFRLVANTAIIIHGLGHTLAIAIIDRQLSALNLTNIFEHRNIEEIFKSLLPFQPLFNERSPLWIASGNPTPWRIRIKAIAGIGLNSIAIIIALIYFPNNNNIYLFLDRAFIVANSIVIISSISDLTALVTGIAYNFYCGNFGFIAKRLPEDGRQLLPERMVNMYYQMGRETEIRGEQAGGGLVIARNQDDRAVFVGKKVVNKKRENLTKSLEASFANTRKNAIFAGIKPLETSIVGAWHYRFATSGSPPSMIETHWHEWMSARYEMVWEYTDGKWVCQRKNVNHRITHNGDFDGWVLFDELIEYDKLGLCLERVLYTPNYTEGDSPKIAGLMDLLVTKGMWYPSVRLAYQLAIAKSIEAAFDGQDPSPNAEDTVVSEQELRSWAEIFENNFILYQKLLGSPDSPACNQYACRLEHDILQAGAKQSSMSQWSWQKRVDFVRTAIDAFFNNDLYFATKIFMSKAEGSFGLVTISTLEEDRLVLSARGQPISVGFNWQEGYMVYASEPAAVDNILLGLPESYRLDLDRQAGEIAKVSANNIILYSIGEKREVSPSELKKRWISMENHPYLPHVKYPQNDSDDPVESDSKEIPVILEEIKLSWQNPTSLNRQSADYLVHLLSNKVQRLEQKREKMLRAGLTSNLQQLPTVDLFITGVENSLWLGERFALDLQSIFPWLNIKAVSANQVLQQLSQDFRSLQLGQESIVLAITQSGQTFPTIQAIDTFDYLYRQGIIGELFILTGELGSFLGSPVIQPNLAENIDIGIYIFGSWLWTLGLRFFQGRHLLARMGKRTLVIGDVFWVNQLLKSYVSKLFALSYGIASLEVHGSDPQDDLLHDFAHRVVRGTLLFLGVPDGRRNHKFKQRESNALMTGKQANGIRNINVGPEVLVMGSNPEITHKGFSNAIVLESNDDAYYFKNYQDKDQKEIIEELRESRFSAFERLLASYVFFWALAKKVASFPLIQYQHWKSQSRTKIMTTAAPVAGINLNHGEKSIASKQKSSESVISN